MSETVYWAPPHVPALDHKRFCLNTAAMVPVPYGCNNRTLFTVLAHRMGMEGDLLEAMRKRYMATGAARVSGTAFCPKINTVRSIRRSKVGQAMFRTTMSTAACAWLSTAMCSSATAMMLANACPSSMSSCENTTPSLSPSAFSLFMH